jgi:hypothetical protein
LLNDPRMIYSAPFWKRVPDPRPANRGKRRMLVLANETVDGAALRDVIRLPAENEPGPEVLVCRLKTGPAG